MDRTKLGISRKDLEEFIIKYYMDTGIVPTVAFLSFEYHPSAVKRGPFSTPTDTISMILPDREPLPNIFDFNPDTYTYTAAHIRIVDYPCLYGQIIVGADDAWKKARIIKRKNLMNRVQALQKEINSLTFEITEGKGADNGY